MHTGQEKRKGKKQGKECDKIKKPVVVCGITYNNGVRDVRVCCVGFVFVNSMNSTKDSQTNWR